MDGYDGIYNCNDLKYNPFELFDNILIHYFLWGSKYKVKKDYNKD